MSLRLSELQDNNKEGKALRSDAIGLLEDWENDKEMLQYWSLLYIPEIIHSKVINYHYDDLLVGHFRIDKIWELVT